MSSVTSTTGEKNANVSLFSGLLSRTTYAKTNKTLIIIRMIVVLVGKKSPVYTDTVVAYIHKIIKICGANAFFSAPKNICFRIAGIIV